MDFERKMMRFLLCGNTVLGMLALGLTMVHLRRGLPGSAALSLAAAALALLAVRGGMKYLKEVKDA